MTKFVRLNKEGLTDFFVDALKVSMFWAAGDGAVIVIDGNETYIDMPIDDVLSAFQVTRN